MKTVRGSYVKRLRDNYLLILRTLMHDIILSIDADGNFAFVNDAAVEFFGKPRKKLIGSHFSGYIHPDDLKKTIAALQELIEQKGQVKGFLLRAKSSQGYKTIACNGIAIFDEMGNYIGAQATGKDLSELLRVEEELKQSKQHFKSLFEVIVDPIVIVDITGTILELSQSAEEIFGFSRDDLVGKSFLETKLAKADTKKFMNNNLKRMKQGEYISPYAVETVSTNGKQLFYEIIPARIVYNGEAAILAIFRNVTEQKKAEDKLRASEERFKYFLDNAPEAIWIQDLVGTFLDGNKRAEELTGYKKEELLGKNMLDIGLVPPETIPRLMEEFSANTPREISGPIELELIKKDGTKVPVEASTIPVERNGKIEIIGITRDIIARKKAEAALQESEKRFRELSELLPETIFETDLNGKLTFVNEVGFKRFGYSQKDFEEGLTAFQMLIPEDRDNAKKEIANSLSGSDSGFLEYTALKKDGSTFPVAINATPIIRDNIPVGLRGILVDITETKKSEEALKKSAERFRSTLDGMLEGCQIIDFDWCYVYVNNTAATHSRVSKKDLLGKTMMEVYPGIDKTNLFSALSKCMKERVSKRMENEFVFPNGESAWFELSVEPVPEGIFILSVDITDRKEVEEALRQEREMLETVTGNINAGLMVVSKDYVILWANNVLKKYLGEIEGKRCYSTINHVEDVCHGCGVKEIFDTGKDWVVHEQIVPTPDGKDVWLDITATAIRDENGEIVAASEMSWDITERKKTENALKESVQKFRTIFEGATDGIIAADPKTQKFVFANPKMCQITGYSIDELLKLTAFDIMPKDQMEFYADQYQKQMDRKINLTRNAPILRKDNAIIFCDISSKLMKIGNTQLLVGFFKDVTEQRKAEEELRESEKRFRDMSELLPEVVFEADINGTLTFVNRAAFARFGYSQEDLEKGLTILGMIVPSDREKAKNVISRRLKGEVIGNVEYTAVRKDGSKFPILTHATPIIRKDVVVGIRGLVVDITERKKVEIALRESAAKYRELLNGMNDTAIVLDFDGKIIDVNKTAVEVLGYSRAELLNSSPEKFDSALTLKQINDLVKKMKTSDILVFETLHTNKNGKSFPVEISASHVVYSGKPAILSIARDITERKKTEEAIKEVNRLLKDSNTELESYTYVVSHDLKAPLRTIKSFGSFLLEDYGNKLDETGQDYLNRMVNASSRLDAMIEDLLILSRVGRKYTEFESINLNKLLNEILGDLDASIKETKTEVVVDTLPTLTAQRVWMRQLFMNLISNALKFNESKHPKIEVLYEEQEADHLFKLRDNGIGIEEKYQERIFNLFERAPTEKKYEGTGAGLSICKKIIQNLGGKIWVESTIAKGSTFFFTIPKEMRKDVEN